MSRRCSLPAEMQAVFRRRRCLTSWKRTPITPRRRSSTATPGLDSTSANVAARGPKLSRPKGFFAGRDTSPTKAPLFSTMSTSAAFVSARVEKKYVVAAGQLEHAGHRHDLRFRSPDRSRGNPDRLTSIISASHPDQPRRRSRALAGRRIQERATRPVRSRASARRRAPHDLARAASAQRIVPDSVSISGRSRRCHRSVPQLSARSR